MLAENIPVRSNGQTILAEWFNTIKAYLIDYSVVSLNIDEDYIFSGQVNTIIVDSSLNDVDVTLPDAISNKGKVIRIIAKDTTNIIEVFPASGLIMSESSFVFKMNMESLQLITDGVDWYAI